MDQLWEFSRMSRIMGVHGAKCSAVQLAASVLFFWGSRVQGGKHVPLVPYVLAPGMTLSDPRTKYL